MKNDSDFKDRRTQKTSGPNLQPTDFSVSCRGAKSVSNSAKKPLIIITGPEGSGTIYLWQSIATANPKLHTRCGWSAVFRRGKPVPQEGVYHASLPALRPCQWLSQLSFPPGTKFVASIRNKKYAVRSAFRRFGGDDNELEMKNYDRALVEIDQLASQFPLLKVRYEDLGDEAIRNSIEEFLGLQGTWAPFVSRNTIKSKDRN